MSNTAGALRRLRLRGRVVVSRHCAERRAVRVTRALLEAVTIAELLMASLASGHQRLHRLHPRDAERVGEGAINAAYFLTVSNFIMDSYGGAASNLALSGVVADHLGGLRGRVLKSFHNQVHKYIGIVSQRLFDDGHCIWLPRGLGWLGVEVGEDGV